jgi:predicted TIM-barrel fold metal-dependent hydrolase
MELRDAIKVLDSDAHARDFDNDIRPYVPEPYRSQKASFIPGEHYDRNLGGTLGHSGAKIEERLAAMDLQQIDTAVLFPTSGLGVGRVRDPQMQTVLCRAYNDFIADYCKGSPRLKAVANLPVSNPAEAAKELNRAVTKLGLCGGMLAAQAHRKNLGSPEFYPLYEEAQRLNTPITIHAFGGDEPGSEVFDQFICLHTTGHPIPILRQLTAMVFGGIPNCIPLRIGYLKSAGWLPYWAERMDEEWEKRGKREAPLCKKKPSEYLFNENSYYGCEPEEKMISYVVNEIGSKTLMYASDYPHWDMSWPESATVLWAREDISLDAKKDLLLNNAKRFYNLS